MAYHKRKEDELLKKTYSDKTVWVRFAISEISCYGNNVSVMIKFTKNDIK